VSHFDRLHPALQHHIVNSLGWRDLRPFQDEIIPSILEGRHLILVAPTAGGKTEAALFPVLSRMLAEGWTGLSVLYVCPIKALLNNLDARLQRYCALLGRSAALWHGDVKTSERRNILREPPDCLLTTPESIEVMLTSQNVDARGLFSGLRVVIVDEIHAFAGDDRGWHLLAVLERVTKMCGRELQRIGLSATVGNPDALMSWLAGSCQGARSVYAPAARTVAPAEVKLDFVGSVKNAAIVVSQLHRGEKRLVFVDSRSRAEELGAELRQLEVTSFVTHSSLSQDERSQAENAFANRDDCVIVATSVLELGIDVGDLDRVIQIDSPRTVAGFLQRMGRTGRRSDTSRNCLFLATREESLVQAAALVDLWREGYVEPVTPPPEPYHVLAQQLMALVLEQRGIGRGEWFARIRRVPAFAEMPTKSVDELVQWMLDHSILAEDQGILGMGRAGEESYGGRNYLELLSVFLSAPHIRVLHGRQELGCVDDLTFLGKQHGGRVLLLGGKAWHVTHVDWHRRTAFVEATELRGHSRWRGPEMSLSFELCQGMRRVLAADDSRPWWSTRACAAIEGMRERFPWLRGEGTHVVRGEQGDLEWWTFAGTKANASLAPSLSAEAMDQAKHEDLVIRLTGEVPFQELESAIGRLRRLDPQLFRPVVDDRALDGLKFSACVPHRIAADMLANRAIDHRAVGAILQAGVHFVQT